MNMDRPILKDLVTHVDDRGYLTECCRVDWEEVPTEIRQVYTVTDRIPGIIRGFHCHDALYDYFNIISGSAKFILFNYDEYLSLVQLFMEKEKNFVGDAYIYPKWTESLKEEFMKFASADTEWYREYTIDTHSMKMLYIPPRWMHGWISLEHNTILLSNASDVFNPDKPDSTRVEWDILGKKVWEIKFK